MHTETINQAYLFLIFMINGIIMGVIFDFFRILRKSFNTPNFVTYIEDILFWICSALIVMFSLFIFNNGEFRGYIFIGLALGASIYMLFFSKLVVKISVSLIIFLKKAISILLKPIKLIIKFTKNIFRYNYKNFRKFCKKCCKIF